MASERFVQLASPRAATSDLTKPLAELSRVLKTGELTSTRLVRESFKEIKSRNGELNAFSQVFEAEALACAQRLDDELNQGLVRGGLHGIPVSVKDIFEIANKTMGFGSRAYETPPARADAAVIRRMRDAGMVVVGTNTLVEFALGAWGTNEAFGTPRNPWDMKEHRVAGGSSSGSAVAVAAGMVPIALGTDSGGSVRTPAALCGVVGFKPTHGVISTQGACELTPSFDTIGILANHVDDARRLFEIISGKSLATGGDARIFRVAAVDDAQIVPASPDVMRCFRRSITRLRDEQVAVETIRLPHSLLDYQARCGVIMARESYRSLQAILHDESRLVTTPVRARAMAGRAISDEAYRIALAERTDEIESFARTTEDINILLTPTTPMVAPLLSEVDEAAAPLSRFTRIVNYLGLCAMTLPVTRSTTELPVGLQVIAKAGEESTLFAFARHIERIV